MASQALYRKWRSQTFDELVGQEHVTRTLINALRLERIAHAYLFAGPRGTGKTSTARLLAKAVNCLKPPDQRPCNECSVCTAIAEGRLLDLIEIDAASNTGVDDIRDLRDKVGFRPTEARTKFYIIDEVHMLSNSAFNALLKTLEEPPDHVIFVLATTEPEKIPATITSRCQRFEFKRISLSDIVGRLRHIVDEEGVLVEQTALEHIARQGGGSMRDSISLLDQLIAYGGETITFELVQTVLGAVGVEPVSKLVDALIAGQVGQGLDIINQIVRDGVDPRQFTREIVSYLRELLLVKLGNGAQLLHLPAEQLTTMQSQAEHASTPLILHSTKLFNQAANDIKAGMLDIPQLPLELALVEALTAPATPTAPTPASPPVTTPSPPPKPSPPAAKPTSQVQVPVDTGHLSYDVVRAKLEQVYADLLEGRTKNKRPGIRIAKTLQHSAQLVKVAGNEIYFSTSQDNKERFEQPPPREAINWVFSQVLGQEVQVFFINKEQSLPTDTVAETDDDAINALIEVAQKLGGDVKS